MAENNEADITTLRECFQCRYDMTGLEGRWQCPECGYQHDASMFSLSGTPSFTRGAWLGIGIMHIVFGAGGFVPFHIARSGMKWLFAIIFVAGVVDIVLVYRNYRATGTTDKLCRFLFSREWVGYAGAFNRLVTTPWTDVTRVQLKPASRRSSRKMRRWRMRIWVRALRTSSHARTPFTRSSWRPDFDFSFTATPAQADAILERIDSFCPHVRGG